MINKTLRMPEKLIKEINEQGKKEQRKFSDMARILIERQLNKDK